MSVRKSHKTCGLDGNRRWGAYLWFPLLPAIAPQSFTYLLLNKPSHCRTLVRQQENIGRNMKREPHCCCLVYHWD